MSKSYYEGLVGYKGYKDFENDDGSTTRLWSIRLENEDTWFRCGPTEPPVERGAKIGFNAIFDKGQHKVYVDSINILAAPEPQKPAAKRKAWGGNKAKDKYWEDKAEYDKEKDLRISQMAAHNTALAFLTAAISVDAIAIPTKKADRLDTLQAMWYELAEELYNKIQNNKSEESVESEQDTEESEDLNDPLPF